MPVELLASIGVFKSMFDMAKGLKDMNDTAVRNTAVIELQENILTAQEQQAALVEAVRELEAQVASFEAWDTEKKRYQLHDTGRGSFTYQLKKSESAGEPTHQLCANCFEQRRKSFLQKESRMPGRAHVLVCHNCGSEIYINGDRHPEHSGGKSRPRGGSWGRR